MIRKLLATTAIATLLASGAYAQSNDDTSTTNKTDTTTPAASTSAADAATTGQVKMNPATDKDANLASNLMGMRVYNGTGDNAENIGEVNDLVLSKDGKVQALVIGVGGFLGIGEKDVAIDYSSAKWEDRDGNRWLVVPTTKDELKAQTAFDRSAYKTNSNMASNAANDASTATGAAVGTAAGTVAGTTADNNTNTANTTAADNNTANTTAANNGAATTADTTQTGAIDRSTLKPVDVNTISADDFIGTTVYGANDERIGEIGDVALNTDGKVDAVVVDVGGFLGIGEKPVAVGMDNLKFMQDNNGKRYLYTNFTEEQLKNQAAYDKSSYAQNRDQQRLSVTK